MCGVVWIVVSLASVCYFPEWVNGLLLEDTKLKTNYNTLWVMQSFLNPAQLCQEGFSCCCGAQACPALFFRGRAGPRHLCTGCLAGLLPWSALRQCRTWGVMQLRPVRIRGRGCAFLHPTQSLTSVYDDGWDHGPSRTVTLFCFVALDHMCFLMLDSEKVFITLSGVHSCFLFTRRGDSSIVTEVPLYSND